MIVHHVCCWGGGTVGMGTEGEGVFLWINILLFNTRMYVASLLSVFPVSKNDLDGMMMLFSHHVTSTSYDYGLIRQIERSIFIIFPSWNGGTSFCPLMLHLHWASKETYHFFRGTLTKIRRIKLNHIWAQISFNTPYQAHLKHKGLL